MTRRGRRLDVRIGRGLGLVERALVYVVALVLVALALLAFVNTVMLIVDPLFVAHDYARAVTAGIDAAFLTIILLELLHTVLSRGPLSRQLQEFLVIGITSAVRHSLTLAAGGGMHPGTRTICSGGPLVAGHAHRVCRSVAVAVPGGTARDAVIDLAINAVGVLILVAALWLVRQQAGAVGNAAVSVVPPSRRGSADEAA